MSLYFFKHFQLPPHYYSKWGEYHNFTLVGRKRQLTKYFFGSDNDVIRNQEEDNLLVADAFRRTNRPVGFAVRISGLLCGLAVVLAGDRAAHPVLFILAMLPLLLVLGAVISWLIWIAYQIKFPDGVPVPEKMDIISPQNFGRVVKTHFRNFIEATALIPGCFAVIRLLRLLCLRLL
jgi:hypothetical protein